jgi:hypothetical protein
LFSATNGANCGVVTASPTDDRVAFIQGPEFPTADWSYCAWHRQGMILACSEPGRAYRMDACNIVSPYTRGALRGGTHLHTFDGQGEWIAFTYEDHVLASRDHRDPTGDVNQRNIGVSVPKGHVHVASNHPRNSDGTHFSVLITKTTRKPRPDSEEYSRACEESWVGRAGYLRADGTRQHRALAFQGTVTSAKGGHTEVFIADLPDDVTVAGEGPLEGSEKSLPHPPAGIRIRRLTDTTGSPFPGIQGPRHWLRSSPDGSMIAFLRRDADGIPQIWSISPNGGSLSQHSHLPLGVSSAFSWSPDGKHIAHASDNSIWLTHVATGRSERVTPPRANQDGPRPEACVFSPDGSMIAYVKHVNGECGRFNQIFVAHLEG